MKADRFALLTELPGEAIRIADTFDTCEQATHAGNVVRAQYERDHPPRSLLDPAIRVYVVRHAPDDAAALARHVARSGGSMTSHQLAARLIHLAPLALKPLLFRACVRALAMRRSLRRCCRGES